MPDGKSLAERIVEHGPVKAGDPSILQGPWTTAADMNGLRDDIIRWQALDAAVAERGPQRCQWCNTEVDHQYLSTGCLHGEHGYCQGSTGAAGAKTPAQCKFCAAPCRCDCHTDGGLPFRGPRKVTL